MSDAEQIRLLREALQNFTLKDDSPFTHECKLEMAKSVLAATETAPVTDEKSEAAISHVEAREIAIRFIDGHFNNKGDHPRISIPANPNRDDDIRLLEYIKQQSSAAPVASGQNADFTPQQIAGYLRDISIHDLPDGHVALERAAKLIEEQTIALDRLRNHMPVVSVSEDEKIVREFFDQQKEVATMLESFGKSLNGAGPIQRAQEAFDRLRNAVREEPVFWIDDYGRKRKPNGDVIEGAAPVPHDAVVPDLSTMQIGIDRSTKDMTGLTITQGKGMYSYIGKEADLLIAMMEETASAVRERVINETHEAIVKRLGHREPTANAWLHICQEIDLAVRALKVSP